MSHRQGGYLLERATHGLPDPDRRDDTPGSGEAAEALPVHRAHPLTATVDTLGASHDTLLSELNAAAPGVDIALEPSAEDGQAMYGSRLDDIPTLRTRSTSVEAARYNRVRLALRRLENPLRLELEGLRGMDMILEDDLWVVVDRTLNDVPVLAWTQFQCRDNLHRPVPCQLQYYHALADLILGSTTVTMDDLLAARLAALPHPSAEEHQQAK